MIAPVLAAAVALELTALPQGEVRYRFELGGERVGTAELRIRCEGPRCAVRWSVNTRAPEAAGGAIHARRVEVETGLDGVWRDGPLAIHDDGVPAEGRGVWGAVPASLAEVVLARAGEDASPCIEIFDERSGRPGRACARRGSGATWELDVNGEVERVRLGSSGLPAEVLLPGQGARFVADPRAEIPPQAPRLYGVTVPGPDSPSGARSFCGVPVDPAPPARVAAGLPPPTSDGASCREVTARWLAAAARAGHPGRTAVGVAWDGAAFSWHAWAEVRIGGGWIPVDPSFGQLPARGPRFTLGRFADGDDAARESAGRRILDCWGRARVE